MRICAGVVLLIGTFSAVAQTTLPAGRYSVGFRALYQMDTARTYDADYAAPGVAAVKKPRPIFIAVWYFR